MDMITYDVDRASTIRDVSDNWWTFAEENDGDESMLKSNVIGHSLFDYITDTATVHLFKLLINRAIHDRIITEYDYRCDAPDQRRYMRMKIMPYGNDLCRFESVTLRVENREPQLILDTKIAERSKDIVVVCSWCGRVRAPNQKWIPLEDGISLVMPDDVIDLPDVSHGICPDCFARVSKSIWDDRAKSA